MKTSKTQAENKKKFLEENRNKKIVESGGIDPIIIQPIEKTSVFLNVEKLRKSKKKKNHI